MRKTRLIPLLAIGAALAAAGALIPTLAQGGGRPDLRIAHLTDPPSELLPGSQFSIEIAVRNAGTARAGKSLARFYLFSGGSRNFSPRRAILLGSRPIRRLRGGGDQSTVGLRVLVPENTRPTSPSGTPTYLMFACVDATDRVPESNERNNCGYGAFPIEVVKRCPSTSATAATRHRGRQA